MELSVLLGASQSPQALQQRRVGIMPHGKQPVGHGEAQVVFVELDESGVQLCGSAQAPGERVRLELKPPTQHSQAERQQLEERSGQKKGCEWGGETK